MSLVKFITLRCNIVSRKYKSIVGVYNVEDIIDGYYMWILREDIIISNKI